MQRQIRFRAWHNGMKKMFGADEMSKDQMALLPDGRFCNVHGENTSLSTFPDMVPMQYIGLNDKNGRELYENDIIESLASDGTPVRHKIVFKECAFMVISPLGDDCGRVTPSWVKEFGKEVIGNTYETPLLFI